LRSTCCSWAFRTDGDGSRWASPSYVMWCNMMCIYIYIDIHCNYGLEVKLEHLHTFAVYIYMYSYV
jgi:hypothetical protein